MKKILILLIILITVLTEVFELPRYFDYIGMVLASITIVLFIPTIIKLIKIN